MRVMLIGPPWGDLYGDFKHVAKVGVFYPPLGLCYLSAYLKKGGHTVRLIDAEAEGFNLNGVLREVERFGPDLIGIQVVSPLWDVVLELCKAVKARWDSPIVLGGPHITIVGPEAFEQNPYFDYGVIGEGEETMLELADRLGDRQPVSSTRGIIYREGDSIRRTPPRMVPDNLDEYLYPDRTDLRIDRYLFSVPRHGIRKFTTITSTRGCPFNCTFCTEPMMFGRKTRFRTPTNVVDEIEESVRQYGVSHFIFVDERVLVEALLDRTGREVRRVCRR